MRWRRMMLFSSKNWKTLGDLALEHPIHSVAAQEALPAVVLALPVDVGHAAGAPHLGHDCTINLYCAIERILVV
jgi:hypothetical protein